MSELSRINDELEQKVQQRTAELELHNRALTFSQCMLDALPVAVIGIDLSGMVVQGSRSAAQLFNSVEGGLLGSDRHEALPNDFNQVINELQEKKVERLKWSHTGIEYDVRFTNFKCFDQPGVVIVMMEKLA
jgi:nitrogen fixation/metabolism regulation signal transduction histidine kinase